jgi:NADPH:quinone reductase-like Zn-dependent oxidoreductase
METMRAAFLTGHGGNEVLQLGERPKPVRGPGEVLVRMCAGGLNRVDLYMRNSGAGITHDLPMIVGLDGSGVVEEEDDGSRFHAGDPVLTYPARTCGRCEFCQRGEDMLWVPSQTFCSSDGVIGLG